MANENNARIINFIQQNIPGLAAVVVVLMLIIPVPKVFIDLLMILNLAFSVIILLTVIYTPRASSFSSFPRITLFATLFGLGINIASTRLILTGKGNALTLSRSQSNMVQAFANIVTGGNNIVIGMVIFIILIVIQVIVITKGATRVSEVAARFTLDSMSTKQFDIDNQLNNGTITEEQARIMKAELRRDIDFYSNMDGSSKFVSGNVTAGIFVTVINLVGGFIIGMALNHLSFTQSLSTYSNLTIGDGLLSQLPSLMLSFATGILVTADKSDESLTDKIKREFSIDGTIYEIVGVALIVMGFALRNGTQYLLVTIGSLFIFYGYKLSNDKVIQKKQAQEKEAKEKAEKERAMASNPESESVALLDPLSLELGYALIPLVDKEKGAELLERISRIRRESALDMGLPVPKIRIIDNMNLDPNEYSFKIRGIEAGRSAIRLGYYMCMNTGSVTEEINGEATKDPAFGMNAIWVPESQRNEAEQAGYAVVDPPTIIATHLTETIRNHASEILGRQEVSLLVNEVHKNNPIVVDEVTNGEHHKFTIGEIQKILQGLLHEQVSIRNMVTILETLSNYGSITTDPWILIDKVREALGLQICLQYADNDKKLRIMNLGQGWSEKIFNHMQKPTDGSSPFSALDPVDSRNFIRNISDAIASMRNMGFAPIIMCSSVIRMVVKKLIEIDMPGVVVLSEKEILQAGKNIELEVLGEIDSSINDNEQIA